MGLIDTGADAQKTEAAHERKHRMVPRSAALPEEPANTSLSGVASMGHAVVPGEIDVSHGTILYLEDVTVSFDGFRALNTLTLSIDVGELRCVIGPNGAGKTTMMDVITGKTRAGLRQGLSRPDDRSDAHERAVDRACGHRPQVSEAHGVRTASRVGKPRTGDEGRQGLVGVAARAAGSRGAGAHRRDAGADRSGERSDGALPASCRTARSSGSKSACC